MEKYHRQWWLLGSPDKPEIGLLTQLLLFMFLKNNYHDYRLSSSLLIKFSFDLMWSLLFYLLIIS